MGLLFFIKTGDRQLSLKLEDFTSLLNVLGAVLSDIETMGIQEYFILLNIVVELQFTKILSRVFQNRLRMGHMTEIPFCTN